MIFEMPIPFTPSFAENGSEDTRNVSEITDRISFAPVRIYTSFYLSIAMSAKHAKL